VEIISLRFGTITWFPSSFAHDSRSFDICGIVPFGGSNLKKLAQQTNIWLAFTPYDLSSSLSLTFPNPDVVDFTWVAMLVTKASNHANLASMVLGWPWTSLVVDPLLHISLFRPSRNLGFY
jgi:hypothetical protein